MNPNARMTLNKVSVLGARSPDRLLYRLSRDRPVSFASYAMPRGTGNVTQRGGQQGGVAVFQYLAQILG